MIRKEGRFDLLKIVIMAFLVLSSINGVGKRERHNMEISPKGIFKSIKRVSFGSSVGLEQ